MSNVANKKVKQYARVDALWKQLMGKYQILREYKTLKIGFKDDLIQAIHNSELFAENSIYIIELFLKKYTRSDKYLKNALKFKTRFDLDNRAVCKIDKKSLDYYDSELKDHNKRKALNAKRRVDNRKSKNGINVNRPILSLSRSS